jgi:hypothetical protein
VPVSNVGLQFSHLGVDQIKLLVERRFVDLAELLRIEPAQ